MLLCLLALQPARAETLAGEQHLPELGAKQASRLLLLQAPLEYPAVAKVNYIQGRVSVRLVVGTDGTVSTAHVLNGNPLLAAAVLNSVATWRYSPYVAKSGPTPFETKVEVNFNLRTNRMDLVPPQAESDFRRQVKPPEVLTGPEASAAPDPSVRLRLLLNAQGKVIDFEILKGIPSLFEKATKAITRWSFRPARWGTLSVPWYLDVDVPVDNSAQAAVGVQRAGGRPGTE